jgi:formylglycine-generating enzyme required for sulfatase activity
MTDSAHDPTPVAGTPVPKNDSPNITRIPLSADPTQAIKLVRPKPAPKPADWTGAEDTLVGNAPSDWKGDDRTVVGASTAATPATPDSAWTGADQTVVTPTDTGWKGADQTVVTPADSGDWKGADQTVVGGVVPPRPAGVAPSDWTGAEATQLGMAAGEAGGKKPGEGGTSHGSKTPGSRPTSLAMDDGWHFKGRQGPLTGTTIGDYEMGGILGEGGMGTVYRAKQLSLKRRAAVKVLPSNLSADMRLRARFEQEAHTASLLNTPHVVQVFGAGADGDIVYFAMEFVEGIDLAQVIHDKRESGTPFTPEEAAGYIIQAARGLAEAAKHNIVHRDIKPANLMVTTKGVVKIADFGISKIAGESGMTMTGTAVGTPAYCSPEQGRGEQVDPRADLYSLGVVFYELLTGQKPFDGTTANALIYQHNYAEPKLPNAIRPELPDAYQAVCLKCLMKNPDQRYGDAAELVNDLERVRDGNMSLTAVFQARFGTGAEDAMAKYLGVNKRWWVKYAIAAGFLILIGGGGLYYYKSTADIRKAAHERELAEIDSHRANLRPLDSAAAIPKAAKDDLAWLRQHVDAASDPDLPRWEKKLERVAKLQVALAPLDDSALPDLALRQRAQKDLTTYADDVGRNAPEVQRWTARLSSTESRIAGLRTALRADLDQTETIGGALHQRVAPSVAELVRLAGAEDADAKRWHQRLAEADAEIAERRTALKVLDAADTVVTESQAQALSGGLARLSVLTDSQADDVARWSARLGELDQQLVALRKTLGSELDRERILTVAQQDAIRPYLERYRARVDAANPQLGAWTRRLDESTGRVAALRKTLGAALDGEQALPSETALNDLSATLRSYGELVAADDAQLATWSARLRAQRDAIDGDRQVLTALDKKSDDHLSLITRAACEKALTRLDSRGAIAADRKGFCLRRLAEEKAYEEALRADLVTREGDKAAATAPETLEQIKKLEAIAGRQDPMVQKWRTRLARYYELHDALADLSKVKPIPPKAAENLAAFAEVVAAGNSDLTAWRGKLARVKQLTEALAGTEAVRPLPAGALANATELVEKWVGEDDPQARSWLAKAKRVTDLRTHLSELFGDRTGDARASNYVLPAGSGAVRDAAALIELTGDSEAEVAHWRYRAKMLAGPGKPAWAAGYERDAYGPYAELTLDGQTTRLRWIPGGTFTIGSPDSEADREADEPQVPNMVVTRGFWLADSECTQGLWQAVMGNNPSRFSRTSDWQDRPVERVSWNDASDFCAALPKKLNANVTVRLPTEAEWEYACRGGNAAPFATFAGPLDAAKLEEAAWFGLRDGTRGVRRRAPNRLGLFDMHGNVWEWCRDKYGTYSAAETIDREGRQEETRVARGGSWADPVRALRAANRIALRPEMRTLYVGFRFAIAAEWPNGQEPQRPGSGDDLSLK